MPMPMPGRPERGRCWCRIMPKDVPFTLAVHRQPAGAGLLHAVTHIEFNAINLALDAVWRFARACPMPYYLDWLRVAAEEALALQRCCVEHLQFARL